MGLSDIFTQVLNMSLTAGAVILVVLAARLVLRRAPKIFSYALWAVVLFRLLCPVSIPSPLSFLSLLEPKTEQSTDFTTSISYVEDYEGFSALPSGVKLPPEISQPVQLPADAPEAVLPIEKSLSLGELLPWLWLTGLSGMLLYGLGSCLCFRRRLVGAVLLEKNVYLLDYADSAFALGLLRPKIYLPSELSEGERVYILEHERHHLRRGDHITKLLAFLTLSIHWFNPLVWLAFFLSGRDMEMSCDEGVLKKLGQGLRGDYCASLLRFATGKREVVALPLAFGVGAIKGRVRNIASWKRPKRWAQVAALVLCLGIFTACAANPGQDIPSKEPYRPPVDTVHESVEQVASQDGNMEDLFRPIVESNLFYGAIAFENCLLRDAIVSSNEENRTHRQRVWMMDFWGKELASYEISSQDAYRIHTLTATQDGGFLFVLGFSDLAYSQHEWASDVGYASRVIKCDKNGEAEFDTAFESVNGGALSHCLEKDGKFYFFGTRETPETKQRGIYSPTDIYMTVLDKRGNILDVQQIAGSDYDDLNAVEFCEEGFLLSLDSQSDDGDFAGSNSGGHPVDWVFTVNDDLEIIGKELKSGRLFFDDRSGYKDGRLIYGSDALFENFDAGSPVAILDYGNFYLIVSENITGEYENTPLFISSIWYYTETVYSVYDNEGELIFRSAADSSPDYDARVEELMGDLETS